MLALKPTKHLQILSALEIVSQKYTVYLAKNREEVEQALRLRFEVFNLELGEGLQESYDKGMDEDKYDSQCDHLLVYENATGKVIGTYRMQSSDMAMKGYGFYTYEEFDLGLFPGDILDNAVELGRACIHKDHRNGRVLFLLWRGLAKYMELSGKRYLFGCCSITSQDPNIGSIAHNYLREKNYYHPDYFADVQPKFECLGCSDPNIKEASIELPQLFRLYLDQGAKVCSPPALDRSFKTIDFLILLDVQSLSDDSKTLFFR